MAVFFLYPRIGTEVIFYKPSPGTDFHFQYLLFGTDFFLWYSLRQSAYRAHHSTEMAVTDVHNRLVRNVDRGDHVSALVLLDLSSAFDTVDHVILLDVLEKRFCITGITLKWYRSYLSDRTQTFRVGSPNSTILSSTAVCHKAPS